MALDAECCYADCHLCCVAFILSVASKFYMMSVVMLNVITAQKKLERLFLPSFCLKNISQPEKKMPEANTPTSVKNEKKFLTLILGGCQGIK